jgi:preprotein translocase SecE subunit
MFRMAFNVYKPGQGYWTRVLSVCGAGAIILAGVIFLWTQFQTLGHAGGAVSRQRAELTKHLVGWAAENKNPLASLKNGIVQISTAAPATQPAVAQSPTFVIRDGAGQSFTLTADQFMAAANYEGTGVPEVDPGARLYGAPISAILNGDTVSIPTLPDFLWRSRLAIQAAAAAVILLGATGLLWWVFNKPRVVDFLIATEAEMKKVNWPTRREIIGSTWVVICGSFMMAILLFGIDVVFAWLFTQIHILQSAAP